MALDKIRFLREQIFLKNIINKTLFVVESTRRDEPNLTYRFECIKKDQKKNVLRTHLTIFKEIAIKRA